MDRHFLRFESVVCRACRVLPVNGHDGGRGRVGAAGRYALGGRGWLAVARSSMVAFQVREAGALWRPAGVPSAGRVTIVTLETGRTPRPSCGRKPCGRACGLATGGVAETFSKN